ncbi:MAG: hypothetical protein JSW09_00290 [Pseudomonadota bacterium]|nr:MAG: hypothetical protein JSW09_00290 [Pseudomonadota bacterium]
MKARHALTTLAVALVATLGACSDAPLVPRERPAPVDRPTVTLKSVGTAVSVPNAALIERGAIPGVYVLNDSGEARFHMVRLGKAGRSHTEILSGLHGNETLVLGDLRSLHDGSPVKPR